VLSGYGAVATPYSYLSALLHRVSERDVRDKRGAALRLLGRSLKLEKGAALARVAASDAAGSGGRGAGALLANAQAERERGLQIADELQREAFLDYSELLRALARQQWSRTVAGRVGTALGWLLSVYADGKVLLALANIVTRRNDADAGEALAADGGRSGAAGGGGSSIVGGGGGGGGSVGGGGVDAPLDPVTRGLELVLVVLLRVSRADAARWLQPVSLAFVATLVSVSVRGFLAFAARAAGVASRALGVALGARGGGRGGAPSDAVVLLLAQLMGCYCVSVLLLLRASVPAEFRRGIAAAIGAGVRVAVFHRLFDSVFVLSAAFSAAAHCYEAILSRSRVEVSEEERASTSGAGSGGEHFAVCVPERSLV
jgi:hypothetical protein